MAVEPELIREYSVRTCSDVKQLSQQLNSQIRMGWHLHSVVPDGRLHLLVLFRLIPRPAPRPVLRSETR